jgi:endonuclease/exonuclease/phosphatase family metal-dependent hydrolase
MLSGTEPTFPAPVPTKCIDYIFTFNNKKVKVVSKKVLNEPVTSDHRPVLVEVKKR